MSILLFLFFSCYSKPCCSETQEDIIKSAESYNHTISLNGQTYYFYAQNSPEWANMLSSEIKGDRHRFGESGCACSALANAIVNSIDQSSLMAIQNLLINPIRIDSTSLVRNRGLASQERFLISSKEDYFRYFPLCVANYAAGNNRIGSHAPRSTAFYSKLLDAFGIRYKKSYSNQVCLSALREGDFVIMCSAGYKSPFSKNGHFILCIDIDEDYVYILDSYIRDSFPLDRKSIIEIVEPGLLRVPIEYFNNLSISGTRFIISPLVKSLSLNR